MHLVIGAGGYAGRHAAAELRRHTEVRTAELWDDLATAMDGAEVVHLAVELHSPCQRARVRAPHQLLVAIVDMARRAGVRRLVHLSSAAVFGFGPHRRVSERTRPRPEHPYERALAADEAWLRQRDELEVVVLRPAQGFGPGEPVSSRLVGRLLTGQLALPGGGRAPRSFLAGADLGRAFHAAAARGQAGMAYQLAGLRGSWLELAEAAAAAAGTDARPGRRSYDLAYLAAALRLPGTSWPTPYLVDLLARPQVVEDGWSRRELSWRPEVTAFAMAELAEWCRTLAPAAPPVAPGPAHRRARTVT